jgi:hypothetical protein
MKSTMAATENADANTSGLLAKMVADGSVNRIAAASRRQR